MNRSSGLGDVAAARAMLFATNAKYVDVLFRFRRLIGTLTYGGPLPQSTFDLIRAGLAGKGGGGWYGSIGVPEFAGLLHRFLQSTAYSLSICFALMNGPHPERNLARVILILVPADGLLTALDALIRTSQATEDAIAAVVRATEGAARSIGRRLGLADLGFEPAELIVGGIVVLVIASMMFVAYQTHQAMTDASNAANAACASATPPCTHEEWASIHRRALEAASRLTVLPAIGQAIGQGGSLLFWGGLLAVGGVLAYGAWTLAPAAIVARNRLASRAAVQGLRGRR